MSWTDRIVEHPNRVRLVPVAGQENTYDMIMAEGEVDEEGTLLNAENLTAETNELIDERLEGRIYPSNFQAGAITFTGSLKAGSTSSKVVTFPTPFVKAPRVVVSVESTVPHKRNVSWGSVTASQFTIYLNTTTTVSNMTVSWIAMEV